MREAPAPTEGYSAIWRCSWRRLRHLSAI